MNKLSYEEALEAILREDPRYEEDAYHFTRAVLDRALKQLLEREQGLRHISGRELMDFFRDSALEQFGPMAHTVLGRWGLHRTEDIGEIVFHLVEKGVLSRTEEDSIADFRNGYRFEEAFIEPYLPAKPVRRRRRPAQQTFEFMN
jgi:uncharacterized repeat protein (TIGR04138 family)